MPHDDAARRGLRAWMVPSPRPIHLAAAREALLEMGIPEAADDAAASELAAVLCRRCAALAAAIGRCSGAHSTMSPMRDGMIALNADLADWLDAFDPPVSDRLRADSRDALLRYRRGELDGIGLFAPWRDEGRPVLQRVAGVLWHAEVNPQWRYARCTPPAVIRGVLEVLGPTMAGRASISSDGAVLDASGRPLGRLDTVATLPGALVDLVRAQLSSFSTVPGQRLLRYVILHVHDQWLRQRDQWHVVEFAGGWSGMADVIMSHTGGGRDLDLLKAVVNIGAVVRWSLPGSGLNGQGLWLVSEVAEAPGRHSTLRLSVGDALSPGLASRLKREAGRTLAACHARRLVPELKFEPPLLVAPRQCRGAALMLSRQVVLHLVDNCRTLHREGAVPIPNAKWQELAHQAGLPLAVLPRLLGAWAGGDDQAPPLLVEDRPGWFSLSGAHAAERDFIAEAGRNSLGASRRGRAGGRARSPARRQGG